MLDHQHVIHLIANSKAPLHAVLTHGLAHLARVMFWGSALQRLAVRGGNTVVVDLLDGGPGISPSDILRLASSTDVWLVTGLHSIPCEWLDLARQPGVSVARCSPKSNTAAFDRLVAALERRIRG